MKKTIQIKCQGASTLPIDRILEFQGGLKKLTEKNFEKLKKSILKQGFIAPFFVWDNKGEYQLLDGHQRLAVLISLRQEDYDIPLLPVDFIDAENEKQAREMLLSITSQYGEFDNAELIDWVAQIDDDLRETLRLVDQEIVLTKENEEEKETEDDDKIPEKFEKVTKKGDLWELGEHRILCGDSTIQNDVYSLMNGESATLGVNDPPYGMKKENDGVMNDNLNYEQLLDFNKKWIFEQLKVLKDNGSFYCFGTDEPIMDLYSEIIKPLIKKQKMTFRNLITWDKGNGQGQNSDGFRMYPIADEKIIFVMLGVQGFNNNSDNYFEGWEPIRDYLLKSRMEMGWDVPTMKKIVGHSDLSRDHWTSKSQFSFPTREVYEKMQAAAREQENNNAFKKEYDELKKEYYNTRAYFNNTHENMNNVWRFPRAASEERSVCGGHATPKPISLIERMIKSSSQENDIVVDFFIGAGSTLIASEKLGRICYGIELSEEWCDVVVRRYSDWCKKNGIKKEIKLNGKPYTI